MGSWFASIVAFGVLSTLQELLFGFDSDRADSSGAIVSDACRRTCEAGPGSHPSRPAVCIGTTFRLPFPASQLLCTASD